VIGGGIIPLGLDSSWIYATYHRELQPDIPWEVLKNLLGISLSLTRRTLSLKLGLNLFKLLIIGLSSG